MASSSSAETPVAIVCIGMAGAGKTTFMQRINAYLHEQRQPPYIINLDPAVLSTPYAPNVDVRDSVNYGEVMKQYNLGPNGGIMTSLNLFVTKIDQVINLLEKRAKPDPQDASRRPIDRILVDTPGQIEVFVWSASGTILLESLASSFPTVIAYIVDTPRTSSPATFMSNMLYACSILYKTKLPMIIVFNKTDAKDASFARDWMTDFEAFQEALNKEQSEDSEAAGVGSGYMGSLLNSMSLVLSEFYEHLSMVEVSSYLGTGMEAFFHAVDEKKKEFMQDYYPELQRRREQRGAREEHQRQEDLDKLMRAMSVGGQRGGQEDEMDVPSDDDDDSDTGVEKGTLQERYNAALGDNEDSVLADASFAKYLNQQR
ncbi:hypothetical protein CDD81_3465 [Ophiocordyceps australis]|uniref:GPN-loop GTPase n=1 Tax=Ophiocordyceps australis TaxID=1399860 RepID=A0A2C5Y8M1_9HYPO|nr:hypothetical protein CDD81_3465 [Ophiocordyceps australis]